jgi:8-oxo-dGTP pyrophosphatase MutT (NUDIX family)
MPMYPMLEEFDKVNALADEAMQLDEGSPFAVFVVAPVKGTNGLLAATTRAKDKGEAGEIGLPGGKLNPGEDPRDAVIREAGEEGWVVNGVDLYPFRKAMVNGKAIWWYKALEASRLEAYKESGRIRNMPSTPENLAKLTRYDNEFIKDLVV